MATSSEVADSAQSGLTLYSIHETSELEIFQTLGCVPLPSSGYHGLRQDLDDAVERFKQVNDGSVEESAHFVLVIHLSALGVAHYTTQCSGTEHNFQSLLFKKTYSDDSRDWQVWYLRAPIPLRHVSDEGNILLWVEERELYFSSMQVQKVAID
jgi:hypothetical protein